VRYPCLAVLLLCVTPAAANTPDIYGMGARATALAGAMTAAVDDTTANFYNPAALVLSPLLQIDTGYLLTSANLRLDGQDLGVDNGNGAQLGVIVPGEVGPVRLAFGLGLFLPEKRLSRVRALPQHQPRFVFYDNRPQRVFINTNFAIRPLPWLHIGGGIAFMTETRGTLTLDGQLFGPPNVDLSAMSTTLDVDFETIRYPSFGLLIAPPESRWSVGVTYREEVKVELDLTARVQGSVVLFPSQLPGEFELNSFTTNLFTPRQLWMGATATPIDQLMLTADVGWLNWASFPAPTAAVTTGLDIEGLPTDGLIPPTTDVLTPDFEDIFSVRTGVEGRFNLSDSVRLDVRAGYAFEPTPAPDQPGETNYVDADKHTVSYGLGLTIAGWNPWVAAPVSIDLGGQTIILAEREYTKTSPTDIIGDYQADGELFTFSGTVRWRF